MDEAGLKGWRAGGAAVSEKHAGFVVNLGDATCADVLAVIAHAQDVVRERFGVELEPEVRIVENPRRERLAHTTSAKCARPDARNPGCAKAGCAKLTDYHPPKRRALLLDENRSARDQAF